MHNNIYYKISLKELLEKKITNTNIVREVLLFCRREKMLRNGHTYFENKVSTMHCYVISPRATYKYTTATHNAHSMRQAINIMWQ